MSRKKWGKDPTERRREARVRHRSPIWITQIDTEAPASPAWLEDVSREGLYVCGAQRLALGAPVRVRLGFALCAVGQVYRVEEEVDGKFAIAIRLPQRAPCRAKFSKRLSGDLIGTPWRLCIDDLRESAFADDCRLRRVRILVERCCRQSWSLEDAADLTGLQPAYFSAFFRRKTGIRFQEWLRSVRVAKAMLLLANQDCSISEVAERVGCQSLRSFQRLFWQCSSLSPRLFRQLQRP